MSVSTGTTKKRRSPLARFLIGTGIGCAVVLILCVGGCVGCVIWLNTPGDVLEPESLLAGDTVGYVEWTADLDDPGTRRSVFALLAWAERARREQAPEGGLGRAFSQWQEMANRRNAQDMAKLFPVVVAATVRPTEDGEGGFVVAVSARGMDHQLRLADWFASLLLRPALDAEVVRHAGETILRVPGRAGGPGVGVFLADGDVFIASSVEEACHAVDVLRGRIPEAKGMAGLGRWVGRMPDTALRGAIGNETGEVGRIWTRLAGTRNGEPVPGATVPDEFWREVEGVVVSGGLDEAGALSVDLEFDLASTGAIEGAEAALVPAFEAAVRDTLLRLRGTDRIGDRLRVTLVSDPLVEALPDPSTASSS